MAAPLRQVSTQTTLFATKRCHLNWSDKIWKRPTRCFRTTTVDRERRWQLHSAVYLQRYPVITPEMTDLEKNVKNFFEKMELNESILSDHELKLNPPGESAKSEKVLSLLDLEDEWQRKQDNFELASRVTAADESNDMTSTQRKLDEKLFLIVKVQYENAESVWTIPHVQVNEGESLREAAERALSTKCGDKLKASILGNAPCGYTSYKLPHKYYEYGVKLFYYKATHKSGNVLPLDNVLEHKWVTLDEAKTYLHDLSYKEIRKFDISI